jgi:hypothetical protein
MMKYILALLFACISAADALADERELSNDEIVKEIKDGPGYKPDHVIFSVKPLSFILGQSLGNKAPFPMKCIQVRARLFQNLGVQLEPVFILGGHGGFGFTAGPNYIPDDGFGEEVLITPKYEFEHVNRAGNFHGFLIEMTRHRLFGAFVLSYGGALGYAINGANANVDSDGNVGYIHIDEGITYDINLGIGFAL